MAARSRSPARDRGRNIEDEVAREHFLAPPCGDHDEIAACWHLRWNRDFQFSLDSSAAAGWGKACVDSFGRFDDFERGSGAGLCKGEQVRTPGSARYPPKLIV